MIIIKDKKKMFNIYNICIILVTAIMACQALYQLTLSITVLIYYLIIIGTTAIISITNIRNKLGCSKSLLYTIIWIIIHIFIVEFILEYTYFKDIMGIQMNVITYYLLILLCNFIICNYIQRKDKYDKAIIIVTLISFISNFIFTINALQIDSNISKSIATGSASTTASLFGVVGFGYIYAIIFVIPFLITFVLNNKNKNRIIYSILLCSVIYFLIKCGYLTAILLTILSVILLIFYKMKKWMKIFAVFLMILIGILCINSIFISEVLYTLADNIEVYTISERLEQMADYLATNEKGGTLERLDLYQQSIDIFKNNILFGKMFANNNLSVSGHSEILDILAYGGIVLFSMFYIAMYYNFKNIYCICKTKEMKRCVKIIIAMFIILNTVNTSFTSTYIYFVIFAIIPAIIRKYEGELSEEKK